MSEPGDLAQNLMTKLRDGAGVCSYPAVNLTPPPLELKGVS
jgi:hypothetical protein